MEAVISQPEPLEHDGLPLPDIWFVAKPETYLVREGNDRFFEYNDKNVRLRLRDHGLSDTKAQGDTTSEVDRIILRYQRERRVDVSIALAGWPLGLLEYGGRRILVNEGAEILKSEDVPFGQVYNFLEELFGKEALPHFLGWLKWARLNIGIVEILPGQIPFFIGPAGVGKSLLQKYITRLLGGRDANPYEYLKGGGFNEDMFEAAHLVVEDRFFEGGKGRSREFGAAIKEIAVNHVHRCHGKFKKAFTAWPKWRMTISMNEEAENLNMLPPLDESLRDKLMLFKVHPTSFPVDMATREGWRQWDDIVKQELPGLAKYIDEFELGDLAAARYGVKAWHDQTILQEEAEASAESILFHILTHDLAMKTGEDLWSGSAIDLKRELEEDGMPSYIQTRRLLSWNNAAGSYLGKLSKRYPEAIYCKKYKGRRKWFIDCARLASYNAEAA